MKHIALLLALVMVLSVFGGCASEKAYVPTGDGLADVAPPTTVPSELEVEAPGSLSATEASFTLAYYPEEGFNPYDCLNINNRMLFSLLYQSLFTTDSSFRVDLKGVNAWLLRRAGVQSIEISTECTACRPDRFWSHRRVGNDRGSLAAIIVREGERTK